MAALKAAPWKCADCRRMVKGNVMYCPGCGQWWETCLDHSHQDAAPTISRHSTYRDQAYAGDYWEDWQAWDRSSSQSPRRRQQRPRSRKYGGKGNGKGKDGQKGQMKGKGQGRPKGYMGQEGMAPLPPPPIPPHLNPMDTTWMQPPPPFNDGKAAAVPDTALQAETKLRQVMGVLKKNETELPPDVAQVLKDTSVKDGKLKIKGMHDAVEVLGDAHSALEHACHERAQNLATWRQFLHQSVQRWQEYTERFQQQERVNLSAITQAKEELKQAQNTFKEMQNKGLHDSHRCGGRPRHGRGDCDERRELNEDPYRSSTIDAIIARAGATGRSGACRGTGTYEEKAAEGGGWGYKCQHASWHGTRIGFRRATCYAAFWWGSQWMTEVYPCGKPAWSSECFDPGLGLRHSVCWEENFTSPFEAQERAFDLAFELGTFPIQGNWFNPNDECHIDGPVQRPKAVRSSATSSVHFAEDVQILFGPEDSHQMFEMQVHSDALSAWCSKPWGRFCKPWIWEKDVYNMIHQLPTLSWRSQEPQFEVAALIRQTPCYKKNRLTDAWHHPLPPEWQGVEDAPEPDPDVIPDPTFAPPFVHDTFELADAHRAFTDLDTDGAMRIRSWYIHHGDLRGNLHPRFLEFEEDWRRWEHDLMGAWRDMIRPNQEVRIHVVEPDPYRGYLPREVHADIIISQGYWLHRLPALITVHQQLRNSQPASYAMACSLARQIGGVALASAADVLPICNHQDTTCTFTHSWATIPFTFAPIFEVHAGDSFVILMATSSHRAPHGSGSSGSGGAEPVRQGHPQHGADTDDDRQRHASQEPDRRLPPDGGGGDGDEEMSSLHSGDLSLLVYRLEAPDVHCFVPGGSYMSILSGILRASGVPRRAARCFHYVAVTPVGVHPASEEAVILQTIRDIQPGSDERLILVDVEIHFHPLPSGLLVPAAASRRVVRIPPQVHRDQILMMVGVREYCQIEGDACVVYENHRIWPVQDASVHDMEHGKHIRVQVPPPRDQDLDTEMAIGIARHLVDNEVASMPVCGQALSLFQRQSTEASDPLRVHFKTDPQYIHELPARGLDGQRQQSAHRHGPSDRASLPPEQRRQLIAALRDADLVECEEEGRIMYLTTWYLHHDTHARCYEGRSIRLVEGDADHWIDEITAPWEHVIVVDEPLFVRVVQPTPPCGDFECVQARIIIEQGIRPQFVSILISIRDHEHGPRHWTHRAYVATAMQNSPSLIRLAELHVRCRHMRCSVNVRDLPFAFVDMEHLDPGTNVVLHLSPLATPPVWLRSEAGEDVDHVEFMQRSGGAASSTFQFNPNAAEFVPNAQQGLRRQPEFVQDLHALWDGTACAWEDEPRAGRIISWFVDQSRGPEVCHEPRTVVLFDDVTTWIESIRAAWRESLDPAANLEFHIVSPQPLRMEPNIIAHVVVVQAPQPDKATVLVTMFDQRHHRMRNRFTRLAVTVHEHTEHQHIVAACGYSPWRSIPHLPFTCQIWYGAAPLLPGRRHPGRDGDCFNMYIIPGAGPAAGNDGVQLLQTHAVRKRLSPREERQTTESVAHAQWPSPEQRIHFKPVIQAFEWVDSHFFLPCFDLPGVLFPHVAASWTQTWWDQAISAHEIRVYFDGSYAQKPEEGCCTAGTAVAAFINTQKGWMFMGALSDALPDHPSSYLAELAGAVAAHKFVFDLLKLHQAQHGYVPEAGGVVLL